jgi:hypothetical protein
VTSHSASVMPIISSLSASTPASNPNTPTEFSLTFSQQPTLVLRPPQTFHSSHPHTVSQTSPSLVLSGYRDSSPGRSAPVLTRVQSSFLPHMSNRTPPIVQFSFLFFCCHYYLFSLLFSVLNCELTLLLYF